MLAVFFTLLMVGITPACAINIEELQDSTLDMEKDAKYLDEYAHKGTWYKFTHIVAAGLAAKRIISNWNNNKSKFYSAIDELKAEKEQIEAEEADNNELLAYYESKQKNNIVKVPKAAHKDAKIIQGKLKEKGVQLKIVPVDLADLKNGTIVQVTKKVNETVLVRYYTYEGITEAGKVKVYNGQEEVEYDPEIFNMAYTGLTFQTENPEKVNEITSLIYQTKINILQQKIRHYKKIIAIVNILLMASMALIIIGDFFTLFGIYRAASGFGFIIVYIGIAIIVTATVLYGISNELMDLYTNRLNNAILDLKDLKVNRLH
jgi:hypothetical protein